MSIYVEIIELVEKVNVLSKSVGLDPLHTLLVILFIGYFIQNISSLKRIITDKTKETETKKENFKKNLPTQIKRHSMIQMLLEKIVFDLKGTKAYVLQYHNGGESVFGIPFAKVSMTNEYCPVGVIREFTSYQNLPLSVYACLSLAANRDGWVAMPDLVSACDNSMAGFFRSRGVESVYVENISDIEGNPLGMIVFESEERLNLDREDQAHFRCLCSKICGLIMCKDVSMDEAVGEECVYNAEKVSR